MVSYINIDVVVDQEWAADWKEVNDIMQPLIQTHEAWATGVTG